LNPDLRIRSNREFFNIKPEIAAEILEDVAGLLEDGEVEYFSAGAKVISALGTRKQGKLFSFADKGLKDGNVIAFVDDANITATVSGDRKVLFEGREYYISALAYELFKRSDKLNNSGAYQGAVYFTFNGVKLKDLPDAQ
jgi:hypothetical protein